LFQGGNNKTQNNKTQDSYFLEESAQSLVHQRRHPLNFSGQPNGVNLQSIGGKVAVPNPFCAPIRDRIQQILKTAGVPPFSKPFLDTWGPHQRLGNIHCATLLFLVHIPEGLP